MSRVFTTLGRHGLRHEKLILAFCKSILETAIQADKKALWVKKSVQIFGEVKAV